MGSVWDNSNTRHNPQDKEGSNKGLTLSQARDNRFGNVSANLISSDILRDNNSLKIMKI